MVSFFYRIMYMLIDEKMAPTEIIIELDCSYREIIEAVELYEKCLIERR